MRKTPWKVLARFELKFKSCCMPGCLELQKTVFSSSIKTFLPSILINFTTSRCFQRKLPASEMRRADALWFYRHLVGHSVSKGGPSFTRVAKPIISNEFTRRMKFLKYFKYLFIKFSMKKNVLLHAFHNFF